MESYDPNFVYIAYVCGHIILNNGIFKYIACTSSLVAECCVYTGM